jgi:hypothetical protein
MSNNTQSIEARRDFIERCGHLNKDIASIRKATMRLAAEIAAEANPNQTQLNALANIEEQLRSATYTVAMNALNVFAKETTP